MYVPCLGMTRSLTCDLPIGSTVPCLPVNGVFRGCPGILALSLNVSLYLAISPVGGEWQLQAKPAPQSQLLPLCHVLRRFRRPCLPYACLR